MGTGVLIAGGFAPADPLNPAAAAHRQAFMKKFKICRITIDIGQRAKEKGIKK